MVGDVVKTLPLETRAPKQGWRSVLATSHRRLLHGLRLWAAVCMSLYVAFILQLDDAYWAAITAALVFQPSLGASLRQGSARMAGTVVGGAMGVLLTAGFPQDRSIFLFSLALWTAACAFFAHRLQNSSSYGAALAGITTMLVVTVTLGPTGGASGEIFMLAVTRATGICVGIVCAGVVLTLTDLGSARRRLASELAATIAHIANGLTMTIPLVGLPQAETRAARQALVARVIALNPMIDGMRGESSDLRSSVTALQSAVDGLFVALSGWRAVANCLENLEGPQGNEEAGIIRRILPPQLGVPFDSESQSQWLDNADELRRLCSRTVRTLIALPAETPSLRVLADSTGTVLLGLVQTLDVLTVLVDPTHLPRRPTGRRYRTYDDLPALISAMRSFVTVIAVELLWIVTAWPEGGTAMLFATVSVTFFSPRDAQAYLAIKNFAVGAFLSLALAGVVKFGVLPAFDTFTALSIVLGSVLVPLGFVSATRQTPMSVAAFALFFIALAPSNQQSYDTLQFYNAASALIAGLGCAAMGILLIPPPSTSIRVQRALIATLRDLRHLAAGRIAMTVRDWNGRISDRLSALPPQADARHLAQIIASESIGAEIIRLRRVAPRFEFECDFRAALDALYAGESGTVIETMAGIDRRLAAWSPAAPGATARLRARGSILIIREALMRHPLISEVEDDFRAL